MKVLFDINHPSQVHTFKNVIQHLEAKGYKCIVTCRRKEMTQELLSGYGIGFISTGVTPIGNLVKACAGLVTILQLMWIIVTKRVRLVVSMESPYAVMAAFFCGRQSLTIADTETAGLIHRIIRPFGKKILVPECFMKKLSDKQEYFKGYKELAYLHPKVFTPDKSVPVKYAFDLSRPYTILRFVAFKASHDRGHSGFSDSNKIRLVNSLLPYMDVHISAEGMLPEVLEKYRLKINPADIHHIIAFASLYAGDSTTMAAEASVLGVPSICLNDNDLGYLTELSEKYELLFKFHATKTDQDSAIEKATELAKNPPLKEWGEKRNVMLGDKIEVGGFLTEYVFKAVSTKGFK